MERRTRGKGSIMNHHFFAAGALAACLAAGGAGAAVLDFSYTRGPLVASSWTMSSTPAPLSFSPGVETTIGVDHGVETVVGVATPIAAVQFYSTAVIGGFFIGSGVGDYGLGALYSGSEAHPTFLVGTYHGVTGGTLTVTDAPTAVPEPFTWYLMMIGFSALGLVLRVRRSELA